jgi:hypothetical protein
VSFTSKEPSVNRWCVAAGPGKRKVIQNLYVNTEQCYKALSDLLTRARLDGLVPWHSMHDPTRPRTEWAGWDNVGLYIREQLDEAFCGYHRNLLQSQAEEARELVACRTQLRELLKNFRPD